MNTRRLTEADFAGIEDALLNALPYVTDVLDDPETLNGFKPGHARKVRSHEKMIRDSLSLLPRLLREWTEQRTEINELLRVLKMVDVDRGNEALSGVTKAAVRRTLRNEMSTSPASTPSTSNNTAS